MKGVAFLGLAICLALLASCDAGGEDVAEPVIMDPATQQALGDPILGDPDLSRQNEGNAALTGGIDHSLPIENTRPEFIRAAREDAIRLMGDSSKLEELPKPVAIDNTTDLKGRLAEAARLVAAPDCSNTLGYSAGWAAKMPEEFPVYPRGATYEAAGSDKGQCAVRAVSFRTPVPLEEVLAFYRSRALNAGFAVEYGANDGEHMLGGTRGKRALLVYGRRIDGDLSEIELITGGS